MTWVKKLLIAALLSTAACDRKPVNDKAPIATVDKNRVDAGVKTPDKSSDDDDSSAFILMLIMSAAN